MELRSYSHLHCIQAIKGNLVIKLMNVNTPGRPTLMFKNVKEIYEAEGTEHHDSVPTIRPKDELESLQFDHHRFKSESSRLPMEERRTIIFDASECNNSDGVEGKNSNLDDFSFGSTTLKQIRDGCKARKRKCSEYVDLCKETFENFLPSEQDRANLETKEDEFDLREPLISWKSKISKYKKSKRKCIRSHMSTISQSATVMVKAEPIDQNFLLGSGSFPEHIDVKLEVNELDYSNCQTKICVSDDSSFDYNEQVDSCGMLTYEARVTASECALETNMFTSFGKEQNCPVNTVNKPSCEYMDYCQTKIGVPADSSFDCNDLVDSCGELSDEAHVPANEYVLETDVSTSFGKEQNYTVSEASCEYMDHTDPESAFDAGVSGWEIVNMDSPEILSYQYPDLPIAYFENEVYMVRSLLDGTSPELILSKDNDSDLYHNSLNLSSTHCWSQPRSNDSNPVQALDMVDNRVQCMETTNGDRAYPFEDSKKDYLPSEGEGSPISSISDCTPSWSSNPLGKDLPLTEEKPPFSSACATAPRSCSAAIHSYDASDELMTSAESTSVAWGGYHHSKLQRPPERLLSTRKTMSPTSQEKLCKAMKSIELHDEKHSECQGKLLFGNQNNSKVVRSEGCNKIRQPEVNINSKQAVRKSKYDKKGSNPKGNLKGPHLSSAVPSLSTCTSPQNISQNAIAFSQRQMHDIESLTTKLAAELISMKELLKETLPSEIFPATSFKHNTAKVTSAIKNATKAEETAKRWLSIMARDCNRFCKIMKLTEVGSTAPSPGHLVHRERKKITFADEAGGKLCHIKVFKDEMTSPLEPIEIE